MDQPGVGFAVLYRWRVARDKEEAFVGAWRRITELMKERRGGLGSRLHRAADGTFIAYAQWPSEEAWRAAGARAKTEILDESAAAIMTDGIFERLEEAHLTPLSDLLVRTP